MGALAQVPLGSQGLRVSRLGLGCMVLSAMYGTPDGDEAVATFDRALERGVTLLDTADAYTEGANERLVGSLLRGRRERVVLATKFGLRRHPSGRGAGIHGRPDYVWASCDGSLARLGVDHIDLYYQHRVDPDVPIEETVGAMAALVTAGKVRHLGLCEALPDEIERAHAVHPITALQSEWSLWARGIEQGALATARRLGIGIVPYGPLGRGFLTGAPPAPAAGDVRAADPRFGGENRDHNLRLVAELRTLADERGATPAQVALAWLLHQGDDVVPIPGTERRAFLDDNLGAVDVALSPADLARLDATFGAGAAGNADGVHLRDRRR